MNVLRLAMTLWAAAAVCAADGALAQRTTKEARDLAIGSAEARYRADKAACAGMSGNAKDICVEEAKGREKIARADAEAAYEGTPKAREKARVARADAAFAIAKERCDDQSGNARDVCFKEATAAHVRATADAKVDRVAADQQREAAEKTAAARRDAADDKRDADYGVALEKCDALSGGAKDACVRDAKARYGKS